MKEIPRIDTKEDMIAFAKKHGLTDWHEPVDMTAKVSGSIFDNAGFWGEHEIAFKKGLLPKNPWMKDQFTPTGKVKKSWLELWVTLFKNGEAVAEVNLATLFAMASDGVK